MATHSSILSWKIPWAEEPGGLQSMGSQRVGHDWATSLSLFTFMHWRRKWQPTPVFFSGEFQGRGAWWASVYGVAQSRTRLKQLSSRSSLYMSVPISQSILLSFPPWYPYVCSPHLCLYFCFANKFIYTIFLGFSGGSDDRETA